MQASKKRQSGVLLHITSVPGPFGIGVFGKEAVDFAKSIRDMGFSCQQILPVNPIGAGNSPYDSESAFGGNVLLIDPRGLMEDGLITASDVNECVYPGNVYTTDYAFAAKTREYVLRKAFSSFCSGKSDVLEHFEAENPYIAEYALYLALKKTHPGREWYEWGYLSSYTNAVKEKDRCIDEYRFRLFCQYIFYKQYASYKKQVNELGIKLVGDMPIYVSRSSADCFAHPSLFDLEETTFRVKNGAGAPPDYFCADGQLWGNPVYNWSEMEKDDYKWWRDRISHSLSMFDTLRIDHFRAFASYWAVPLPATNAKSGSFLQGPGEKLFDLVKSDNPDGDIIAEDLGVFGDDVISLLRRTGYAGMRIIQFGFDPNGDSTHLPHNYPRNSVAFTGTHDNNTLLGYLWETTPEEKRFAFDYCGFTGDNWGEGGSKAPACRRITEAVWRSSSYLAIIPFQDMCGFGCDARMNIPGVPEGNWRYRTTEDIIRAVDADYYKKLNHTFRR